MPPEGDKSFEVLALPHLEAVYRVARRLARHDHEAEDLAQETYLKAYKAFNTFEMRECGIRPWLLRILHNTFLNRQSRERKAPRATDQQALEQMYEASDGDGSTVPPQLDYENMDDEVKRAIDDLAPEFRSVLLLWATMDLSYKEIAVVLSVPIGTVMSRLHRARQKLVQALADFARRNRIAVAEGQ